MNHIRKLRSILMKYIKIAAYNVDLISCIMEKEEEI